MIELGDLVVYTPCQKHFKNENEELLHLAGAVAYRNLRKKISCGVVIDRIDRNDRESPTLRIIFPEGSYNMDIEQVTAVNKWYVGNKL